MSVRVLNRGSLAMAGCALGALVVGLITGSVGVLAGAISCALILVLLQGLAFSREVGARLDDLLDRARPFARPANDNTGGQP